MIFFIIQWRLSIYSSYFVTMVAQLRAVAPVCVIDCCDEVLEESLIQKSPLIYDHYIQFGKKEDFSSLVNFIEQFKDSKNLVISNSIRNNLSPGKEISSYLKCEHVLFEHLGGILLPDFQYTEVFIQDAKMLKKVFVPSEIMKDVLGKTIGEANVEVNYLIPAAPYFDQIPVRQEKEPYLLYVGKLSHQKNVLEFMKANEDFLSLHNLKLLLIGSGSDEVEIKRFGENKKCFEFIYPQIPNEIVSYMDGALALVNPSPIESYSMVAIEALIRGVPVIGKDTGIIYTLKNSLSHIYLLDETNKLQESWVKEFEKFQGHLQLSQLTKMFLGVKSHQMVDFVKECYGKK